MEQELYKIEHTNMYGKTYFCTLKNDVYMTPLGFKSLERSGWTEYADEHLAFITDSSRLSEMLGENGIKTDFVLCIICLSGKLQVSIDNVSQTVCRHQTMVSPINSLVTDYLHSPDFQAVTICANPSIFKDLYVNNQIWEYYQFVLRNHVIEFEDSEWERLAHYYELMLDNLCDQGKKFQDRIVKSLWQTIIYEFLSVIDRYVAHVQPSIEKSINSELLCNRFMEMLALSEGRIHSVADYATRLFVTPKYLSMAVKQTTGRTALQWIHEAVAKEAERLLQHSSQSIKEVSSQLNFPNASFFGKFVKTHLGDTPANIRRRQSKKSEITPK